MCGEAQSFLQLAGHAESDAWLSLGLMHYLAVVPLTLQLACLSGFLWSRTLQGNRAQRIETLLLHEFHARKFILPDKPERAGERRSHGVKATPKEDGAADADGGTDTAADARTKSKGPQYAGERASLVCFDAFNVWHVRRCLGSHWLQLHQRPAPGIA
jgi:DNA polymerase alpha subunit A